MSSLIFVGYVALTAFIISKITSAWTTIKRIIQELLVKSLMNIHHVDGHVMPGAPIRWKSYFDEVNFFGRDFSKVYGCVYYVWHHLNPVVILADVDAIRSFYKDHFSHKRLADFSCAGPGLEDVIGASLGVTHGRDKVKAYRGHFEGHFSASTIKTLHPIIGKATDDWLMSLPVNESLDLSKSHLTDIALKALTCICYGSDVTTRHLNDVKKLLQLHDEALVSYSFGLKALRSSVFRNIFPQKQSSKMQIFQETWHRFHRLLLKEREELTLRDTEGIFFQLHDSIKSGSVSLSYKQLLDTVDEILLFNVDISFAATSFVIHDLSVNPHVQTRLQQEVDNVVGDLDPTDMEDLEMKLPYLQMVIKESARMNPALGSSFPELTVKEETNLAGYLVPKNTIVCVDPHSVNYDATYWPEPETFDPERFASGKSHMPYSFFRFGLGPRKCLGYRLAHSLIMITVIKLMQRYSVAPADRTGAPRVKTSGSAFFTPYLAPNIVLNTRAPCLK